jgi:hypothetical protein
MIDRQVHQLLVQAVDTPTKLQLLLMFHEHSLEVTPPQMAERLYRDIWSVSQALYELAEDGILELSQAAGGEPTFYYHPRPEYIEAIQHLVQGYNDPLERGKLRRSVKELAHHAAFRRSTASEPLYW